MSCPGAAERGREFRSGQLATEVPEPGRHPEVVGEGRGAGGPRVDIVFAAHALDVRAVAQVDARRCTLGRGFEKELPRTSGGRRVRDDGDRK